jgi:BCD family chlorophyll transporter-like MFS transporter
MKKMQERNLTLGRNIKIGFFHLGSGMADVMTTGVWNRIMISDLGFAATPIGLLVSLRYFLAPLGIWAGRMSDQRGVGGFRRLFWVWLGRAMMVVSVFILGLQTAALARGAGTTVVVWVVLMLALLLFSMGSAFSGSTFLALIHDRAAPHQRGRAVGIVWTFLLLGFTVGGIFFGVMLPLEQITYSDLFRLPNNYFDGGLGFSPEVLQNLFVVAGLALGSLWFFSVLGEERRIRDLSEVEQPLEAPTSSLRSDLELVWLNRSLRFFAFYLALSMIFAFSQDLILEPFAGDVFDMSPRVTTRFAGYWGSMSILGTLLFLWIPRFYKRLTNTVISFIGVMVLIVTFILFGICALAEIRGLVTLGLIFLGFGLGIWNIGTLGMMMDMSPSGRAGTFLGFWTLLVTFARGFGVSGGGIVRDVALQLMGEIKLSYGAVFILGAIGLCLALYALSRVHYRAADFAQAQQDVSTVLARAME